MSRWFSTIFIVSILIGLIVLPWLPVPWDNLLYRIFIFFGYVLVVGMNWLSYLWLKWQWSRSVKVYANSITVASLIKLFLSVVFIAVLLWVFKRQGLPLLFVYLILYFYFMGLEVVGLLLLKREE